MSEQVPTPTKDTVRPFATVQDPGDRELTVFVPSPLLLTVAKKLAPKLALEGRFVTDGAVAAAAATLKDSELPLAAL